MVEALVAEIVVHREVVGRMVLEEKFHFVQVLMN